jgi:hypothetical protein
VELLPSTADAVPNLANVLVGIAHLGMVSAAVVQQLWLPHRTIDRARVLLRVLSCQGLITSHYQYQFQAGRPPRRAGCWWALTRKGLDLARTLTGEQLDTPGVRSLLLQHDGMVVEATAVIIAYARRHALSSVVVRREASLVQGAQKPKPDALIIVRQLPGHVSRASGVPWSVGNAQPGEQATWLALEADNDTEDRLTIVNKALVYRDTWRLWHEHGRTVPRICWVAPTVKRRDQIHRWWQDAWPDGTWLLATVDEVQQGVWWQAAAGHLQAVHVFRAVEAS